MKKRLLIFSFLSGVLMTGASYAQDSKVTIDQYFSHHQQQLSDESSHKMAHIHDHMNDAKQAEIHAAEHGGSHVKAHMHDHDNDKGLSEAHSHHH